MMQENLICPYPGLRPFNEEESIFFKGREEHIEKIIALLEKNKFLMLTGASGDGKSSLVYAGLVPSARAGFFKARYNNWLVADFRPERTPLRNLARSLASHFNQNEEDVEKEISHGFSSLVKLYKSTPFYIDQKSPEWVNADDKGKRVLKRKGGNLLILVDQFEEFFTNPENYTGGKPSVQAQAVINLLLETAKIALEEDLPIYIICTMRSDYIGQCADFRGLPEFIGFSQFFVPRLKRKEIHQVIEEPAVLSGSKISNRLTETLISELVYGLDQLPLLQHALNQVWNITTPGEEMDLIHLAKLAGLSREVLPEKDKAEFDKWLVDVPEYKKSFYSNPCLNNILNAHANDLYVRSGEYYTTKYGKKISSEDVSFIIKTAFQCLTKIDDSRAVRNRMTLLEITSLIGRPDITPDVVGGLLDVFRMQGNTFLKPFITDDDPSSVQLNNNDVLDITHESLIRNWNHLKQWAEEDNENRQVYLDFYKQLERWIANGKSKDYLLSAGPLSFFETWYQKCKPNKFWLLKFDESDKLKEDKLAIADKTIKDTIDFIHLSKKALSRKRNIFIFAAATVIFALSVFTIWAMMEKKNALVQKEIATEKTKEVLASSREVLKAKNAALELKDKAEESEFLAIISKESAEKAKKEALEAKAVAEIERVKAEKQTLIAMDESKKAEEQRQIANESRDKALIAETKAKYLTLISVTQALAMKSTIIEDSVQLQSLLAVQSYNFTVSSKENTQNPIIYDALIKAYTNINQNNTSLISNLTYEPRTLLPLNQGTELLSTGKQGTIDRYNVLNGTIVKSYAIPEKKIILYTLFSPDGKNVLRGYIDGEIALYDISNLDKISKTQINKGKQQLSTATFNTSGTVMVTVTQDSIFNLWNINGAKIESKGSFNSHDRVRAVVVSEDGTTLYYSTEKGDIHLHSTTTNKTEILFSSKSAVPLCLALSEERNTLAAGFSDGKVRVFNLKDRSFKVTNEHSTRVELVLFNPTSTLMVTSSSDKTIRVYDLQRADSRPIVFRDQQAKARSITFVNDHAIAVGLADKTIQLWELSSEKIVEKLCPLIKRNLSKAEWLQYVGEGIEYQKTCK